MAKGTHEFIAQVKLVKRNTTASNDTEYQVTFITDHLPESMFLIQGDTTVKVKVEDE